MRIHCLSSSTLILNKLGTLVKRYHDCLSRSYHEFESRMSRWYFRWRLCRHMYQIIHLISHTQCSPINHLHSSVTSAQMYFVARVMYNLRMVSSTRITMYHVVHCLTLSLTSLCLLASGSTVTVWTAQLQVHLCLMSTKCTHSNLILMCCLLLDSTNTSNYSFT